MSALQVGTGVIVIAVIWIASLVFGILLLRASGSAKWVIWGVARRFIHASLANFKTKTWFVYLRKNECGSITICRKYFWCVSQFWGHHCDLCTLHHYRVLSNMIKSIHWRLFQLDALFCLGLESSLSSFWLWLSHWCWSSSLAAQRRVPLSKRWRWAPDLYNTPNNPTPAQKYSVLTVM